MKHCSNQLAEGFEIQLIFPLISIRAKIAVLFIGKINIFLSNTETNKKNRRKRAAFAAAEFSLSGFEAQNDSESDGKS